MDLLQVWCMLAVLCGGMTSPLGRSAGRRLPRGGPSRRMYPPPPPQQPRTSRSSLVYALAPPAPAQYQPADSPTFTLTQDQYLSALQSLSPARQPSAVQPKEPVYHATPVHPFRLLLPTPQPVHEEAAEPEADSVEPVAAAPLPQPALAIHNVHDVQEIPSNHQSVYPKHLEEPSDYAAKYQFGYHVRDPKHGSFFGHSEARDGHRAKGHYHVLLPDGRLQNVQYWADPSGYHAQVSYDGVARHYQ